MANALRGETEAIIGGIARRLRLRANEMVELQDYLGRGPVELVNARTLDFKEAAAIIHFGLRGCGATVDMRRTLEALDGMPVLEVLGIASKVLIAGLGVDLPKEDDLGNASAPGSNGSTAPRPS